MSVIWRCFALRQSPISESLKTPRRMPDDSRGRINRRESTWLVPHCRPLTTVPVKSIILLSLVCRSQRPIQRSIGVGMGGETPRIGDYEVLNLLGAGGMGRVYRVRNVITDRIEAMKVLLPEIAGKEEVAARFLREIKV